MEEEKKKKKINFDIVFLTIVILGPFVHLILLIFFNFNILYTFNYIKYSFNKDKTQIKLDYIMIETSKDIIHFDIDDCYEKDGVYNCIVSTSDFEYISIGGHAINTYGKNAAILNNDKKMKMNSGENNYAFWKDTFVYKELHVFVYKEDLENGKNELVLTDGNKIDKIIIDYKGE